MIKYDQVNAKRCAHKYISFSLCTTGADPGFSFRGAQKIMCPHAHYERGPNSLSAGVQGPCKGPGRSRVDLMLSRAI